MPIKITDAAWDRAADALVEAVRSYGDSIRPRASNKAWRKIVADALDLKRLYQARWDTVLFNAEQRHNLTIEDDRFVLGLPPLKHNPFSASRGPRIGRHGANGRKVTHTRTQGGRDPVDAKSRGLGALLDAKLREESATLPDGVSVVEMYCHCPSCGSALRITGGTIRAGEERGKK